MFEMTAEGKTDQKSGRFYTTIDLPQDNLQKWSL